MCSSSWGGPWSPRDVSFHCPCGVWPDSKHQCSEASWAGEGIKIYRVYSCLCSRFLNSYCVSAKFSSLSHPHLVMKQFYWGLKVSTCSCSGLPLIQLSIHFLSKIFKKLFLFICWVSSCGLQDFLLQHVGSFVVVRGLASLLGQTGFSLAVAWAQELQHTGVVGPCHVGS